MRLGVLALVIVTAIGSRARAQDDDEARCARAHALLDRDALGPAERALAGFGNDELGEGSQAAVAACVLTAWGRLASARGEPIRAAVFLERALRAAATAPPSRAPASRASFASIERLRDALPERARALGDVVIAIDAEEPAELPGVPTLRSLCELVRAIEELGYWDLGAVRCEVAHRAEGAGVAAAALRVVASRTLSVEELVIAIRGPDGWHVVARDLGVDVGHGMVGALRIDGCAIRAGVDGAPEVVTSVRVWQGELAPDATGPPRRWDERRHVCARAGGAWRCHVR